MTDNKKPSTPDLTRGVSLDDFVDSKLLGHVGEDEVLLVQLGPEVVAIDPHAAARQLPALLNGYLRLGACVGDGAVLDRQFGTTDVLMLLPISIVSDRYIRYFSEIARR